MVYFLKIPKLGIFVSFSIILSTAYTIYMFNRIGFGGTFSKFFEENIKDISKKRILIVIYFNIIYCFFWSISLFNIRWFTFFYCQFNILYIAINNLNQ